MRTAVISDLHSNLEALDAVLSRVDELRCERLYVLGDIVGYGADPNGVIERLAARGAVSICGNHDLAVTGAFDVAWFNEAAAAAVEWTAANLDADAQAYLDALSPMDDRGEALLVHGSVRDPVAEYLVSVEAARQSFALGDFRLGFFGHTHLPTIFTCAPDGSVRGGILPVDEAVPLEPGVRYLLNPGSVGQPRDQDPRAAFLVWENGAAVSHRVSYDVASAQRKIRDAGLPGWLADRLAVGE